MIIHTYLIGRVRSPTELLPNLARELDWHFADLCDRNPSAAIVELVLTTDGEVIASVAPPSTARNTDGI